MMLSMTNRRGLIGQGWTHWLLLGLVAILISQPLSAAEPLCSTDIDGDGSAEAASDGQLLVRYLFGFQGDALTDGLIAEGCVRCDAAAIASHLETTACQVLFDVDGDGRRRPLTDGLLHWRLLSGYSGSELIAGALGDEATRRDPEAMRGWLAAGVLPPGEAPYRVQLVSGDSLLGDQIQLEWLTTSDNDTPVSQLRYVLHASTQSGFVPSPATANTELVDAAYGTLTGLTPETRYYLKVEALDSFGNNSWSNELSVVTAVAAPTETGAARILLDASNALDLIIGADSLSYRLPQGASVPAVGDRVVSSGDGGFLRRVEAVEQSGAW